MVSTGAGVDVHGLVCRSAISAYIAFTSPPWKSPVVA
jgi:hypothetical protein